MKICPVASSSKGNMYVVSHGEHSIIIDAGVNGTNMKKFYTTLCGDFSHLIGIFITHVHGDHCSGLNVFSNKLKIEQKKSPNLEPCPIYCDKKAVFFLGEGNPDLIFPLHEMNAPLEVGPFRVESISVPHDSPNFAYLITCGEEKLGICTDLGYIEDKVLDFFQGVQVMVLEANYDPQLLTENEDYDDKTKRRIFSDKGHLSNEDSAWAACELCEDGLKTIIFAHLSQENNTHALVETAFQEEMKSRGKDYPCTIAFAPPKEPIAWYEVGTGKELLL